MSRTLSKRRKENMSRLLRFNIQLFAEPEKDDQEGVVVDEPNEELEQDLENEEETVDEEQNKDDKTDKPWKNQENATNAEKRREREKEEAEREAYKKGVKRTLGDINPYTKKDIKTNADFKIYEDMKEADEKGLDPLTEMPNFYATKFEEEENKKADQIAVEKQVQENIEEFSKAKPDVELTDLFKDERWLKFSKGKLEGDSLLNVYKEFLEYESEIDKKAESMALKKNIRRNISVGSLANDTVKDDMYTMDELKKMSQKDVGENYDKVIKSYDYWTKKK